MDVSIIAGERGGTGGQERASEGGATVTYQLLLLHLAHIEVLGGLFAAGEGITVSRYQQSIAKLLLALPRSHRLPAQVIPSSPAGSKRISINRSTDRFITPLAPATTAGKFNSILACLNEASAGGGRYVPGLSTTSTREAGAGSTLAGGEAESGHDGGAERRADAGGEHIYVVWERVETCYRACGCGCGSGSGGVEMEGGYDFMGMAWCTGAMGWGSQVIRPLGECVAVRGSEGGGVRLGGLGERGGGGFFLVLGGARHGAWEKATEDVGV